MPDRLTDEQIAKLADPQTGLAERAKQVLRAVARGEVYQLQLPGARVRHEYQPSDMSEAQPVTTFTLGLRAYGLIRLAPKATEPAIAAGRQVRMWGLTPDGERVAVRIDGSER